MQFNNWIKFLESKISEFDVWHKNLHKEIPALFWTISSIKICFGFIIGTVATLLVTDIWPNVDLHWKGAVVTTIRWIIGVSIFATFFYLDFLKGKRGGFQLFWRPWIYLLGISVFFIFVRISNHQEISNYKKTLESTNGFYQGLLVQFTNNLSSTNIFYTKIIGADDEMIKELRSAYSGQSTKMSPAQLMGLHDETNYTIITNSISLTNFVVSSYTFYGSHPILDFFQMNRITQKAKSDLHIPLKVLYVVSDTDSSDLAKQIAQVFLFSGYNALAVGMTNQIQNQLPKGLSIMSKNYPSGQISAGFFQLCSELGQNASWTPAPTLDDSNIIFIVNVGH